MATLGEETKNNNNNYFKLMLDDIKRVFNGLEIGQKFALVTLVAITLMAATFFAFKLSEPNWEVLYSDLSEPDAVSVIEGLKKGGYAYKISKDKQAILVPSNLVDDLRVYVAENDLIQDSTPGFELLDEMQLGSTDFKNELTKQRIFQGELTRSIEKMAGIKKARVQLAQPERSVFTDNDEIPSASVMLILQGGYKLKSNQVKAIKNIVAYSVPRLKPDMVFITDQNGNNLTDDVNKNTNDIESFKANFEAQTTKKIEKVLEKIVGRNNSTISVSAEIDFNSAKSTIESYIPVGNTENGVMSSQQTEAEIYEKPLDPIANPNENNQNDVNNNAQTNQTQNQVTTTQQQTQTSTMPLSLNQQNQNEQINNERNLNYQKSRTSVNYNVSKEVKQVVYAPGSVKRMTIAVAVNKILTEEESQELKNLIMNAAGADESRGDIISITSMQFLSLDEELKQQEALAKEIKQDNLLHLIFNKIAPLLIVMILGLTALFTFKSMFSKIVSGKKSNDNTEGWVDEDEAQYQHSLTDDLDDMLDMDELPQIEAKLDPEIDKKKSDLTETIMADPQEATRLLISYIKD